MKPLAERTRNLTQSNIRAVTLLLNEYGSGGINLGQGICDMPTPDPIKAGAVRAIEENMSIYSFYGGIRRLRQSVFEKVVEFNGIPLESPDDVMVTVGSTGAFVATMLALLNAGDEVIVFEPFYGYHINLLTVMGINVRYVSTLAPAWTIDFGVVEDLITDQTKAILVTTPGNPNGKVWRLEELESVLVLLTKYDLFGITDEIYEYMLYDGAKHVSLASLPGALERTISLSGFSKTYNMTGWRLGYATGPKRIISTMGLLSDLIYICAPTPLQHGVADAFDMPGTYFTDMASAYDARRTLLCSTLERIGFDVPWPEGSYYVLADFEVFSRTHDGFTDDESACHTLVRTLGIGTVPGRSFFYDDDDGRYKLRFCFAKQLPVLQKACDRLIEAYG